MKEAKKIPRNVRLFAEETPQGGAAIYIDFSGDRHYLMPAKPDHAVLRQFGPGVRLEQLERMCRERSLNSARTVHFATHVLRVALEYIEYEYSA